VKYPSLPCHNRLQTSHVKIPKLLTLVLPILFPSWRFFSSIGPSPRIELGFSTNAKELPLQWIAFRPLPKTLSFKQHLLRLVHNPQWNELLFINSCAERVFETGEIFYREEIAARLLQAIRNSEIDAPKHAAFMHFRICAIYADSANTYQTTQTNCEIFLQSTAYPLSKHGMPT
jgi:hypothetical protein